MSLWSTFVTCPCPLSRGPPGQMYDANALFCVEAHEIAPTRP
jgi:hypothetical protein